MIVAPKRGINVWTLAALTFIAVAGGGFGIEDSVRAGGALPVFLSMVFVVPLFAVPQAVVTAELVNLFPVNGGYVVWISAVMGRRAGFVAALCGCSASAFDLGLSMVLLKSYVSKALDSSQWLVVVQACGLVVIVMLNCLGMTWVSRVSAVYLALTVLPFVVQMCTVDLKPSVWTAVPTTIQYDLLCNSILWNFKGWGTVAMYSGELHNPRRTFPIGVAMGAVCVCVIYVLPLLGTATACVLPVSSLCGCVTEANGLYRLSECVCVCVRACASCPCSWSVGRARQHKVGDRLFGHGRTAAECVDGPLGLVCRHPISVVTGDEWLRGCVSCRSGNVTTLTCTVLSCPWA